MQTTCRLDYDDDANEMLKAVLPNASSHKLLHNLQMRITSSKTNYNTIVSKLNTGTREKLFRDIDGLYYDFACHIYSIQTKNMRNFPFEFGSDMNKRGF